MRDTGIWTHSLSQNDLVELATALDHARQRDIATIAITPKDFPLPTMGPRLISLRDGLINGRGFVLLRGLPIGRGRHEIHGQQAADYGDDRRQAKV